MVRVAPYVGAWVETARKSNRLKSVDVAPYVGAWVETYVDENLKDDVMSHLTWVRGLKPK